MGFVGRVHTHTHSHIFAGCYTSDTCRGSWVKACASLLLPVILFFFSPHNSTITTQRNVAALCCDALQKINTHKNRRVFQIFGVVFAVPIGWGETSQQAGKIHVIYGRPWYKRCTLEQSLRILVYWQRKYVYMEHNDIIYTYPV